MTDPSQRAHLSRIADALERLVPAQPPAAALDDGDAFIWHADGRRLELVADVNRVDLELLRGIDRQRDQLLENTRRFARGLPANNALLWGARGTGKSSIVKAVHAAVNGETGGRLALVEIHRGSDLLREDIPTRRCWAICAGAAGPASCSATTFPSTGRTPPTSRSRRCWKAASRAGRPT